MPPGWDPWYAFTGTRAHYYDYDINENDKIKTFGSGAGDYSTDVLKARAVRFIKDQRGATDPFFDACRDKGDAQSRQVRHSRAATC